MISYFLVSSFTLSFSITAQIAEFNLMTAQPSDTEFSCQFSLTAQRDGQMTGFAGYFDAHFDLPCPVTLPTGPNSTPTHWKQTIFYLPHPQSVTKGMDHGKAIIA